MDGTGLEDSYLHSSGANFQMLTRSFSVGNSHDFNLLSSDKYDFYDITKYRRLKEAAFPLWTGAVRVVGSSQADMS